MNNYQKDQTRFNESSLDVDINTALEWLVNYSSAVKNKDLTNCLLVDASYNIIGFKYNGVKKSSFINKKDFSTLEIKKLTYEKPKDFGHCIIGIDKTGVYKKENLKYSVENKSDLIRYFFSELGFSIK